MMPHQQRVAVIGAGISGLCAAYFLSSSDYHVTVLEKNPSAGGVMQSRREGGWLIETGPNSTTENTPLFQKLFDELHLRDELLYANESASKRYIVKDSILHPLPAGPASFMKSQLWSMKGKLRLLKEPFIGTSRREESVAEFARRRLGTEFLDYGIDSFVAGIYAGDPEKLSMRHALPKLSTLEEQYGSLLKGMISSRKKSDHTGKLFSFRDGMQTLPNRLAMKLGDQLKSGCTVERVIPMRAGKYPVYTITYLQDETRQSIEADVVIFATPAYVTASIIRPIDPDMAATLNSITYPPIAEIFLGFRQHQIHRPLDGFGFLVPKKEQKNILGTIWSSALFPGRAPQNSVALTTFVGGTRQPELISHDDVHLIELVTKELQSLMNVSGIPVFTHVTRWERAIPQYNLGYGTILKAVERFEQNFRGAFICGNYRGGVSIGDCVENAKKISDQINDFRAHG